MIVNPDWIAKIGSMMQPNPQSNPLFLKRISNPGAIHQKGMQSRFCNPAIAILMMPGYKPYLFELGTDGDSTRSRGEPVADW